MEKISVRIDNERRKRMKDHPEINWSEVTRQEIDEKIEAIERLERMNEVGAPSTATADDVDEIADRINEGLAQRHGLREQSAGSGGDETRR